MHIYIMYTASTGILHGQRVGTISLALYAAYAVLDHCCPVA